MYRHTQTGFLILGVLAATAAVLGWTLVASGAPSVSWASLVIVFVVGFLFGSLTVEVDHRELRFWFGPGLLRKTIPLSKIEICRVVTNRWWYGWGIRWTPRGRLYNVSGLRAVELKLRGGLTIRIGTDEPEKLCRQIDAIRG